MIPIDLHNRTALVTGGGRGLGAAAVRMLHRAGADVAVNYFADPEGLNRARGEQLVGELGEKAMLVEADVRDPSAVAAMLDAVFDRFGRLDVIVNNAGIIRDRTARKMSDDDWRAVLDTNLTGVFHVCRAAVGRMPEGGRIVNLASISAFVGTYGQANYAAAKAGVVALTKVLSREFARQGITVNAVAPGVVLTEMGLSIPEEIRGQMLEQIPLGRFAEPEEIAGAILYLCSELASYITGQTLHVNGGWYSP